MAPTVYKCLLMSPVGIADFARFRTSCHLKDHKMESAVWSERSRKMKNDLSEQPHPFSFDIMVTKY